jgi:hypothetical protein
MWFGDGRFGDCMVTDGYHVCCSKVSTGALLQFLHELNGDIFRRYTVTSNIDQDTLYHPATIAISCYTSTAYT